MVIVRSQNIKKKYLGGKKLNLPEYSKYTSTIKSHHLKRRQESKGSKPMKKVENKCPFGNLSDIKEEVEFAKMQNSKSRYIVYLFMCVYI